MSAVEALAMEAWVEGEIIIWFVYMRLMLPMHYAVTPNESKYLLHILNINNWVNYISKRWIILFIKSERRWMQAVAVVRDDDENSGLLLCRANGI